MPIAVPDVWVVLRLRRGAADSIWLGYGDDRGNTRIVPDFPPSPKDAGAVWRRMKPTSRAGPLERFGTLVVPRDIEQLFVDSLAFLPVSRSTAAAFLVSRSLPVFVDSGPGLEFYRWERLIPALLSKSIPPGRIQVVRLAAPQWKSRAAPRLPLNMLALGASGDLLGDLSRVDWLHAPKMRQHGLVLAKQRRLDPELFADPDLDIVVASQETLTSMLEALWRNRSLGLSSPRLVVGFDPEPRLLEERTIAPVGTSVILVPQATARSAQSFLASLTDRIARDLPLHQAFKDAGKLARLPWARLQADPASNQDLRLSKVLADIVSATASLGLSADPGDSEGFLTRLGEDTTPQLESALRDAVREASTLREVRQRIEQPPPDTGRPAAGIVEIVSASEGLAAARSAEERVKNTLRSAVDEKTTVAIERHQDRRVDIGLQRLEAGPGAATPGADTWMAPNTILRALGRYRVCVQIGRPFPVSLLATEAPPLDPLLPDEQGGHWLEIAVFPLDFVALSPEVSKLRLPPLGGAGPATFDVRAPAKAGPARLRIGVYHQNYLLQSFLLTAQVGAEEAIAADRALDAVLEACRSARFTNLDALGARALSLGIEGLSGTHSLSVKGEAVAADIRFTEAILSREIESFRRILTEANNDDGSPRFPVGSTLKESATFRVVVRDLAQLGKQLARGIFQRGSANKRLVNALGEIAKSHDETIQIVRHDPAFAFPWAVLYDYGLPQPIYGAPPPKVCLGERDDGTHCGHGPGQQAYCVRGFWGVRHRIEELVSHGGSLRDGQSEIKRIDTREAVRLVLGVVEDPPTQELVQAMSAELGPTLGQGWGGKPHLLDLLWDEGSRPSILVVIGHQDNRQVKGEPEGPRIVLVDGSMWLRDADVVDRAQGAQWGQPCALVLLLACESGALDVGTITHLVTAFETAGAAAVVGTECPVFTDLVARFAREVVTALWKDPRCRLGTALLSFRRALLREGNPLGFAFTVVGDADVTVAH